MTVLVILLGVLMLVLGFVGVFAPRRMLHLVDLFWKGEQSLYVAAAIRFAFGAVLIIAAPATRWPTLITVLGVITFVAAFVLLFVGFKRMDRIVQWVKSLPPAALRLWCLVAVAFGCVMVAAGL